MVAIISYLCSETLEGLSGGEMSIINVVKRTYDRSSIALSITLKREEIESLGATVWAFMKRPDI